MVKQCSANRKVAVLHHSPFSPDVAPVNSCLFLKLRFALEGQYFQSTAEIQAQLQGN
jgi:hypothetical protein